MHAVQCPIGNNGDVGDEVKLAVQPVSIPDSRVHNWPARTTSDAYCSEDVGDEVKLAVQFLPASRPHQSSLFTMSIVTTSQQ